MLNAETPRLKFAVYGAHDDLGSALLVELLSRQHEAVALLDDLNSLSARPGLRTKPGDLFDPLSVSESVAGMDAVICLYHTPRLPSTDAVTGESPRRDFYQAVEALLLGLQRVGVERNRQPGVVRRQRSQRLLASARCTAGLERSLSHDPVRLPLRKRAVLPGLHHCLQCSSPARLRRLALRVHRLNDLQRR